MLLQIYVVCSFSIPAISLQAEIEFLNLLRLLGVIFLSLFFSATLFGQLWRLEPLPSDRKVMWRREMEWLLCVADHIVELIPSWQTFPDGTKLEVFGMLFKPFSVLNFYGRC